MKWRVLELERNNAFMNMAIDESVCEHIADGASGPTIRFYTWKPSAVSIGCFQSMNAEVNVALCKDLGIDFLRRQTGGGAVFHDEKGELTYSVIAPERIMPKGIPESYKLICGWIVEGLAPLGIKAAFAPINDIVVNGKKISGNAQTRRDGVLWQHGTVLYNLDLERMFSVLNVSREKISDKMLSSAKDRVTCVLDHAQVPIEALYASMLKGFTSDKEWAFSRLSESESATAEKIARSRYMSESWNFAR